MSVILAKLLQFGSEDLFRFVSFTASQEQRPVRLGDVMEQIILRIFEPFRAFKGSEF